MKPKLLWAMGIAVGAGVGTGLYQLVRYAVSDADWQRAIFVALFTCLVALVIPRKWILR